VLLRLFDFIDITCFCRDFANKSPTVKVELKEVTVAAKGGHALEVSPGREQGCKG
jgi:hypothetical protein